MFVELMLAALAWATAAIVISLLVSVALMRMLGLKPKDLVHEIEEVQNPAVGACFFIVALTTSLFISVYSSGGFSVVRSFADSALWFASGLLVSAVYVVVLLTVAQRVMDRQKGEALYQYLRRELVEEQNAALAFFLGGLTMPPFIAVLFQIL